MVARLTVPLTGCGKTMSVRQNVDGPHVWLNRKIFPQDAQKGQTSHPPNPGAPRRAFSPARPFKFSLPLFRGVAEAALYCVHRTSTVSSCAFCEQEGHLAAPSPAGGLFQHPAKCLGSRSSETRQLTSKPLPSRRRDSSPRVVHYKTHGGHWGRS